MPTLSTNDMVAFNSVVERWRVKARLNVATKDITQDLLDALAAANLGVQNNGVQAMISALLADGYQVTKV